MLEAAVGYRAGLRERLYRLSQRHPNADLLRRVRSSWRGAGRRIPPGRHRATALGAGRAARPGLRADQRVAIGAVNQLVTLLLPPRPSAQAGVPGGRHHPPSSAPSSSCRRCSAACEAVRERWTHLEVQYLANREPNLQFALLSDFTDATTETTRATTTSSPPRPRASAPSTRRYAAEGRTPSTSSTGRGSGTRGRAVDGLGAEARQAGGVQPLPARRRRDGVLHRRGRPGAAAATCASSSRSTPTRSCPATRAARLVGTLAHPLNRAGVRSARRAAWSRGYGILQPRVSFSLPSATRSRFAAISLRPSRASTRTRRRSRTSTRTCSATAASPARASTTSTPSRRRHARALPREPLPQPRPDRGQLRPLRRWSPTSSCSTTIPARYHAYARREHRWVRGDWQLLRWLGRRCPAPTGREPQSAADCSSRWKIFDNLRRSLVALAQLVLLSRAGRSLPGSPLVLDGGSCWSPIASPLARSRSCSPPASAARQVVARRTTRRSAQTPSRARSRSALTVAFLPHQAGSRRRHRPHAVPRCSSRRQPPPRVADRRVRPSAARAGRPPTPGAAMWPARSASPSSRLAGGRLAAAALLAGRCRSWRPAGCVARRRLARVSRRPTQARPPPDPADARAPALRLRAQDLALLRDLRQRRRPLAAAGQLSGGPGAGGRHRTSPTNIGLQLLSTLSGARPRLHRGSAT